MQFYQAVGSHFDKRLIQQNAKNAKEQTKEQKNYYKHIFKCLYDHN